MEPVESKAAVEVKSEAPLETEPMEPPPIDGEAVDAGPLHPPHPESRDNSGGQ
jgi:hypothetical protein